MKVKRKKVEFKNRSKLTLRGMVWQPQHWKNTVIFLHGFPSSTKSKTGIMLCNALSKHGYLCLQFDFSGTNSSDGRFEDKLMSLEADDIKFAIDFLFKNFKFEKLFLIGHSSGAIAAALYAYRDKRIAKVVLMGGVGNLSEAAHYDFPDLQVKELWERGYTYKGANHSWKIPNRGKIKKAFYDEFFTLDLLGSLSRNRAPVLIVHGSKDRNVLPWKDPYELYSAARKPKRLVIIKGADHRFSSKSAQGKALHALLSFLN